MNEKLTDPTLDEAATIAQRLDRIERAIEQLAMTDNALIDIGERQLNLFDEIASAVRPPRPPEPRRRHLRVVR